MPASAMLAVEATDKKYFGLKHMPGGRPLDKDGKGEWPADQFTFRLIQEGALREQRVPAATPAAPAPAAVPAVAAAADEANPLTHLREIVDEAQHEIEHLQGGAGATPVKA